MNQIFNTANKIKLYLITANILLVFFLILLSNLGVLPLHTNDFIFFAFLTLAFALYRPGWAFLFFVGTIALENINLAPTELGMTLRPYQFIGALTILAIVIRLIFKRINFALPKLKWFDALVGLLVLSSFLSIFNAPDKISSFKLAIIIFSFLILYFLTRLYVQAFEDLKRIVPFFLSSALIITIYGVWQNIQFMKGLTSFEVMPGRPNATFSEADWLGTFLVFLIALLYASIKYLRKETKYQPYFYTFLTLIFTLLILTVSRSAWLGAMLVTFIFLFILLTDLRFAFKKWDFGIFFNQLWKILLCFIISLILVLVFQLTNFKLSERAQSSGGLQKITIACEKEISLPDSIINLEELNTYACRQINLEEITQEKAAGNFVTEIYRPDPNINIRQVIYQKSWNEIKNHWLLGIGWGSIGQILGKDERGANLNSSNIFLEVWLGSGLIGILSFITIWLWLLISAIIHFSQENRERKILGLFLILGAFAFIIPNLFNAGLLMGIIWLFFGIILTRPVK